MQEPDALIEMRERIASLQTLSCRLAHEKVLVENGIAQRRSQGVGIEPAFVRVGLCTSAIRSRQLSCAHTTSRQLLEQAIDLLRQAGALTDDSAQVMRNDLHRISDTIHRTDWDKNATEVRYAALLEQHDHPATSTALQHEQAHLTELVQRHQEATEELRRMHDMVLTLLDAASNRKQGTGNVLPTANENAA